MADRSEELLVSVGALLLAAAVFAYWFFTALILSPWLRESNPVGMELVLGVMAGIGALGAAILVRAWYRWHP